MDDPEDSSDTPRPQSHGLKRTIGNAMAMPFAKKSKPVKPHHEEADDDEPEYVGMTQGSESHAVPSTSQAKNAKDSRQPKASQFSQVEDDDAENDAESVRTTSTTTNPPNRHFKM